MGFSDRQTQALARGVPAPHVKSRMREGKELHYVEGWYVLAQANRIFGFDGWDRETINTKCILARETRGTFTAVYSARVRVTVRTAGGSIIRDGHGTGEAHGNSAGEVHDRALKAAETDATKRALATFGKAFGLALYAGNGLSTVRNRITAPEDQREPRSAAVANPPHQVSNELGPKGLSNKPAPAVSSSNSPDQLLPASSNAADGLACAPAGTGSLVRQINKSALTFGEPHRVRDKQHLRYVASQSCLVCNTTPCDAHHIRFAQPRALGRKVGDEFTVPLCRSHHRELHHSGNEATWWHDMGIDPHDIAQHLWSETVARAESLSLAAIPSF